MAATITNPGDGSIILTFQFQAEKAKVENVCNYTCAWLYNRQPSIYGKYDEFGNLIPFNDLTTQQLLNILNTFVKINLVDVANRARIDIAAEEIVHDGQLDLGN